MGLSQDEDKLTMLKSEQEYDFSDYSDFKYGFIALLLCKYDKNLVEVRDKLVPVELSEEQFWMNYFYAVEEIKLSNG